MYLIKRSSFSSLCLFSFITPPLPPPSAPSSTLIMKKEKKSQQTFVEHLFCPRNCTYFFRFFFQAILFMVIFPTPTGSTIIFLLRLSFSRQCVTYFYWLSFINLPLIYPYHSIITDLLIFQPKYLTELLIGFPDLIFSSL